MASSEAWMSPRCTASSFSTACGTWEGGSRRVLITALVRAFRLYRSPLGERTS